VLKGEEVFEKMLWIVELGLVQLENPLQKRAPFIGILKAEDGFQPPGRPSQSG
jgi:hypothetical protein